MKKIRILAIVLAVLMLPLSVLVGCTKNPSNNPDGDDNCNHKWGKAEQLQKTGCVAEGVTRKTCKNCGKVEIEYEAAYGHDFSTSQWEFNNDATCTEDGTESRLCVLRDYAETRPAPGTALGHDFVVYKANDDGLTETATCRRCQAATDTRLLAVKIDFEGNRDSLSYDVLKVYGTSEYKTADENTYLEISRAAGVTIGSSAYGLVFTPRYASFKDAAYVVEYDVKITEDTKDLVLLSGSKEYSTEYFLTYNAADRTLCTTVGAVYTLKAEDIGAFKKISVVLNDADKEYDVYFDGALVVADVKYATEQYFPGFELIDLRINLADGTTASTFAIDNIDIYAAAEPRGFEGDTVDPEFEVFTTRSGAKIMIKIADDTCTHGWGDPVTVAPTCTASGYDLVTCTLCGGQKVENETNASSHDMQFDHKLDPTCTATGYEAYKCTKCGFENANVLGALGHILTDNEDLITVNAPTCTAKGYTEGPCGREGCGEIIITNYVNPLGHEFDPNSDKYKKVDATCDLGGYEESQCVRCEEILKRNEVAALGHDVQTSMIKDNEGEFVIQNKCARCEKIISIIPLSTEVPDDAAMTKYMGTGKRSVINFTPDALGKHGDKTIETGSWGIQNMGGVPRFGQMILKDDENGDRYAVWEYSSTGTISSGNGHCYFDFASSPRSNGKDVCFEFEVKRNGDEPLLGIDMQIIDRSGAIVSGNQFVKMIIITDNGVIQTGDGKKNIAEITADEWTRIGLVFHFGKPCFYDIYVDGILETVSYPLGASFLSDDGFRIERLATHSNETSILIDDIYCYYSSIPAYCCGMSCDIAGHLIDLEKDYEIIAPTCTEKGYTLGTCRLCGEEEMQGDFVDPLGHDILESDVVAADCTTAGSKHVKCQREGCDYEEDIVLEALGHTLDTEIDPVVTAPTCEEDGFTTVHCSVCDKDYTIDPVTKLGHDLVTVPISAADCVNDGSSKQVCQRDGCDYETEPTVIPALGHKWGAWVVTTPATCKDVGSQTRTCPYCERTETEEIPVSEEHTWGEWIIDTAATCAEGARHRICEICELRDDEVIPASGEHQYGETQIKPATLTETGLEYQECAICHNIIEIRVIPKLAGGSKGIDYILNDTEDGYIVAGFGEELVDTAVVIPSEYNELPVVGIGFNAFKENTSIVSIDLPDTITSIDMFAFKGCTALTTITIRGTLTAVASNAFKDCDALTTVIYLGGDAALVGETYAQNPDATILSIGNAAFFNATWVFSEEI